MARGLSACSLWMIAALTLASGRAQASPGPADQVDAPNLVAGELSFQGGIAHLMSKPIDGDRDLATVELGYDFSDRFRLTGAVDLGSAHGAPFVSATNVEAIVRLGAVAGVNTHVRLGYQHDWRGHDDRVEATALFNVELGRAEARLHLLANQGVGAETDMDFGYGALVAYRATDHLKLGAKALGGLGATGGFGGRQTSYFGPTAIVTVPVTGASGQILIEAAYLFTHGAPQGGPAGLWSLILQWEHVF